MRAISVLIMNLFNKRPLYKIWAFTGALKGNWVLVYLVILITLYGTAA